MKNNELYTIIIKKFVTDDGHGSNQRLNRGESFLEVLSTPSEWAS